MIRCTCTVWWLPASPSAAERARIELGIDDSYRTEQRYLRRDGEFVWARTQVSVIEENGDVFGDTVNLASRMAGMAWTWTQWPWVSSTVRRRQPRAPAAATIRQASRGGSTTRASPPEASR